MDWDKKNRAVLATTCLHMLNGEVSDISGKTNDRQEIIPSEDLKKIAVENSQQGCLRPEKAS